MPPREANALKVRIRRSRVVGQGLECTTSFKKDQVITYYMLRVHKRAGYRVSEYAMDVHTPSGNVSGTLLGDLAPPHGPYRGIPHWGHLVNEARSRGEVNVYYHFGKHAQLKSGDLVRCAVRASRPLSRGEMLLADYGPNYYRSWESSLHALTTES